jgi:hypothetical protein
MDFMVMEEQNIISTTINYGIEYYQTLKLSSPL